MLYLINYVRKGIKMKKTRLIILVIIAIIFVAIISSIMWYKIQQKPVNVEEVVTKNIEIVSGTSTVQIVDLLKENDLVRSSLGTKIYIKLNGIKKLQAGKYSYQQICL